MRPRTPPTLRSSKMPQDPLFNFKAIKFLGISLAWWVDNLLDINRTRDKIAQVYIYTNTNE